MLYSRDYSSLTEQEMIDLEEVQRREKLDSDGKMLQGKIHRNLFFEYPKAAKHYLSLFPNNYLDQSDLTQNSEELHEQNKQYLALINQPNIQELDIKSWIKHNEAFHVIGSILNGYNFGHHSAYLFTEFPIGTYYAADYLIVGVNSDGYHFIFCEFESISSTHPNEKVIKNDGSFGNIIEKGIAQIDDWKSYFQSNFQNLEMDFLRYKNKSQELPSEFRRYNSWRMHYVVVAGRRMDFLPKSRELRLQYKSERNIDILHYDNLFDKLNLSMGKATY